MSSARERVRFELLLHRRAGLKRLARRVKPAATVAAIAARPPAAAPTIAQPLFVRESMATTLTPEARSAALAQIAVEIGGCTQCKLCKGRNRTVPGEGALDPPILFIGEGPGADEDASGRPFVGRAGQLLDKMIAAIKFERGAVYIANIVKCRPPENRTPEPEEVRACLPYLDRQIALIQPQLICTLGLPATRTLIPEVRAISAVRGRVFEVGGRKIVPTFHPAYLLRNPPAKREAWEDLQLIAKLVGRPVG